MSLVTLVYQLFLCVLLAGLHPAPGRPTARQNCRPGAETGPHSLSTQPLTSGHWERLRLVQTEWPGRSETGLRPDWSDSDPHDYDRRAHEYDGPGNNLPPNGAICPQRLALGGPSDPLRSPSWTVNPFAPLGSGGHSAATTTPGQRSALTADQAPGAVPTRPRPTFHCLLTRPAGLRIYLYAHANPVNNTDPSGYLTLTETQTTIANIARISANIGSKISRLYQTAQNALDAIQLAEQIFSLAMEPGLFNVGYARIAAERTPGAGNLAEAPEVLRDNARRIGTSLLKYPQKLGVSAQRIGSPTARFVIFMPTPNFKPIQSPPRKTHISFNLRGKRIPVYLYFGNSGHRGRLFGFGIATGVTDNNPHQLFRMDWHPAHYSQTVSPNFPTSNKNDWAFWTDRDFHFHIPRD